MTKVIAVNRIAGTHNWGTCPNTARHNYLKHEHRHVFYIETIFNVTDEDRQLEIFEMQDVVDEVVGRLYDRSERNGLVLFGERSCEMIAREICHETGADSCEVREDGEGGAIYVR